MRIEHERPHACIPLSIKTGPMVACRVKDPILMGCEGIVCFGKGYVVIGSRAQRLPTVANHPIIDFLIGSQFHSLGGNGGTTR